jgi:hypothetical protein
MRVPVVEDVPRLAHDIAEGLRDQAMAVDVAYDGLEAVAKLNLNRYDVVVLDRDLLGAGDYLSKPFHFPELVLRIRGLARRKPTAQPRVLRAGDLELDPLRRTITRAGKKRDLSQGVRPARGTDARGARPAQRRGPPRACVGRKRRSLHQDCPGHHRLAPWQTRRSGRDRHHPRSRLPHRRPMKRHHSTALRKRRQRRPSVPPPPILLLHACGS